MPLKFSDGAQKTELTTGSVPTLGVEAGERKVSSESRLDNAVLMLTSTLVIQSEHIRCLSNDIFTLSKIIKIRS